MVVAVLIGIGLILFGWPFDDDGDVTTVTETVPPTAPEKSKKSKKDKGSKNGDGGGAAAGGPCAGTEQITRLRARGTSCAEASSVSKQWHRRQSQCNTVDNPSSPIGFKRTCNVSGYKCTATRDTSSDERDVRCTRGSLRITFTYLP